MIGSRSRFLRPATVNTEPSLRTRVVRSFDEATEAIGTLPF
jgi:hypothetical protein